ncbi:MAG: DUF2807 domain-containing protein [Anaerolineae bacterium]|nr:DUF2807 domain-containing protein [Anaerolineae bacterium]
MKTLLLPLLTITALFLNACGMNMIVGSGKLISETRKVKGFEQVVLSVPARLVLTQDETESLEISAEDNLLPYIHTRVENGILSIYLEPEFTSIRPTEEILIHLSAKSISAVTINGSGDVESEAINAETLTFRINGSGEIAVEEIEANQLSATINGAGKMRFDNIAAKTTSLRIEGSGKYLIAGKSVAAQVSIDGSGRIEAQSLECEQVQASITGAGNISVWASERLTAKITGSGDIAYQGQAKVSKTIIGSGSVHQE